MTRKFTKILSSFFIGGTLILTSFSSFANNQNSLEEYNRIQQSNLNLMKDKEFMNKAIEAQNTKTKLSEVQKNDELLGITDFWKGISMEDLEGITYDYATDKFYPSSKEFSKKAEKMNKKFEKMKDKVNDFNRKKGNKEVAKSVGGSSGTPGPWNNGFNKSIPKKGYVIIGDKDNEFQAYGEFEHAGIFNSDANHKKVVWSSPGYGCVSGYEWEIDWQTMYSDVYVMKVWVANDSQRIT